LPSLLLSWINEFSRRRSIMYSICGYIYKKKSNLSKWFGTPCAR
jgi:hypothetical protein